MEAGPGLTLDPSQAGEVVSEGKQTHKDSETDLPRQHLPSLGPLLPQWGVLIPPYIPLSGQGQ